MKEETDATSRTERPKHMGAGRRKAKLKAIAPKEKEKGKTKAKRARSPGKEQWVPLLPCCP